MDFWSFSFFWLKNPKNLGFLKTPILQPWVHARLRVNNITRDIVELMKASLDKTAKPRALSKEYTMWGPTQRFTGRRSKSQIFWCHVRFSSPLWNYSNYVKPKTNSVQFGPLTCDNQLARTLNLHTGYGKMPKSDKWDEKADWYEMKKKHT